MTRIAIAPDLMEEAVFLRQRIAEQADDPRGAQWLEARERLYEVRDIAERNAAFAHHAMVAFKAMHFDEPLRCALELCPSVMARLEVLYVRRARRVKEEAAELYCATAQADNLSSTRAVLALRPERFVDLEGLYDFVWRELLYIDDMLNPHFGYDPSAIDALDLDPGMRDVIRERASRAWKQRVEGRSRGHQSQLTFGQIIDAALASLANR